MGDDRISLQLSRIYCIVLPLPQMLCFPSGYFNNLHGRMRGESIDVLSPLRTKREGSALSRILADGAEN